MTKSKVKFNTRREVIGVALANLASGMTNGIPATAALARTALNVKSGATNRMSGIINCIMVTIISIGLLPLFEFLLLPVVAAMLIQVAVRMIEFEVFEHLYHMDKKSFILAIVVAALCVLFEPTTGLVVGMAVSLLMVSDSLAKSHGELIVKYNQNVSVLSNKQVLQIVDDDEEPKELPEIIRSRPDEDPGSDVELKEESFPAQVEETPTLDTFEGTLIYRLAGQLTFVNANAHFDRIRLFSKRVTGIKAIILSMRYLYFCDVDGIDVLCEIIRGVKDDGLQIYITGLNNSTKPLFSRTKEFKELDSSGHILWHFSGSRKESEPRDRVDST